MKSISFREFAEMIGIISIVASLIFLALQVQQTHQIAQGDTALSYMEATAAFKEIIIENADVWTRGCEGGELSATDQTKYIQLVRSYGMYSFFTWRAARDGVMELDPNMPVETFAANVHRYPGFAEAAVTWGDWIENGAPSDANNGSEFSSAIEKRVAELQIIEPSPNFDSSTCGL
jgi:hypothetical protein